MGEGGKEREELGEGTGGRRGQEGEGREGGNGRREEEGKGERRKRRGWWKRKRRRGKERKSKHLCSNFHLTHTHTHVGLHRRHLVYRVMWTS